MRQFPSAFLSFIVAVACCAGCGEHATPDAVTPDAVTPDAATRDAATPAKKSVDQTAAVNRPEATTTNTATATPAGGKWGTLKGRFVVKEMLPAPGLIAQDVCNARVVDESVVVDKDGNLANVMIYLAKKPAEIHPDYEADAKSSVTLDNQGCRFEPHTLGMRAGQQLIIKNLDAFGHNCNVAFSVNDPFNTLIPAGGQVEVPVDLAETRPTDVSCNIHPWMRSKLLVRPDPYFAISAKDGTFEIKNLPVGSFEFVARSEKYISKVKLGGKDVQWPKGKFNFDIKPGDNDLGEIIVAADNLQ